jgi:hypothetical protein
MAKGGRPGKLRARQYESRRKHGDYLMQKRIEELSVARPVKVTRVDPEVLRQYIQEISKK